MDDVTMIERKPSVAIDKAVVFSMRNTPLLQQGTIYDPLATARISGSTSRSTPAAARTRCTPTAVRITPSSFCRARPPSPSATAARRSSANTKG